MQEKSPSCDVTLEICCKYLLHNPGLCWVMRLHGDTLWCEAISLKAVGRHLLEDEEAYFNILDLSQEQGQPVNPSLQSLSLSSNCLVWNVHFVVLFIVSLQHCFESFEKEFFLCSKQQTLLKSLKVFILFSCALTAAHHTNNNCLEKKHFARVAHREPFKLVVWLILKILH